MDHVRSEYQVDTPVLECQVVVFGYSTSGRIRLFVTVYMVMTTLILQLFDAIEYTSWMYRSVSVDDQFSFVILCVFVWMQVIVDDDARVVEMLYH